MIKHTKRNMYHLMSGDKRLDGWIPWNIYMTAILTEIKEMLVHPGSYRNAIHKQILKWACSAVQRLTFRMHHIIRWIISDSLQPTHTNPSCVLLCQFSFQDVGLELTFLAMSVSKHINSTSLLVNSGFVKDGKWYPFPITSSLEIVWTARKWGVKTKWVLFH